MNYITRNTRIGLLFQCLCAVSLWLALTIGAQTSSPSIQLEKSLPVAAGRTSQTRPPSLRKPNIIFILADDLGWGDLSVYGHDRLKTPNLDRMAAQGTLLTNFYVNGSVCSPSRCAFFTGQYPARHRIHGHYATPKLNTDRGMSQWLDPKVPNAAALLKGAGYRTAHIGKWHLGPGRGTPASPDPAQPKLEDYGFDFVGSGEGPTGNVVAKDDPYYRARSSALFVDEACWRSATVIENCCSILTGAALSFTICRAIRRNSIIWLTNSQTSSNASRNKRWRGKRPCRPARWNLPPDATNIVGRLKNEGVNR